MYTISVQGGFRAVHHVRLPGGTVESPHAHDWKVRVHYARTELDSLSMVADFDEVKRALTDVLLPLENADLNDFQPLAGVNPTAEAVARLVFDGLASHWPAGLFRVEVTEAPGCVATYAPAETFP